jgi:flagellar FliL protein
MSDKAEKQTESPGGGKKKGLLLVVLVAVAMLGLGGGGAWFFLSQKKSGGEHAAEVKPAKAEPPVFFTLEPFVVNLAGEETRYLQVGIDLKVADSGVIEQIKVHMPEIKNGVLLLLSSKTPEEIASLDGKNQLRGEIRDVVNRPLGIRGGDHREPAKAGEPGKEHASGDNPIKLAAAEGVVDVLLTSFVIQ